MKLQEQMLEAIHQETGLPIDWLSTKGGAEACAKIAIDFVTDFALWSSEDVKPMPFMSDPRYELMIQVDDTIEQRKDKLNKLLSLYIQSLTPAFCPNKL